MRKISIAVTLLVVVVCLPLAAQTARHPYLVGTRGSARAMRLSFDDSERHVVRFRNVDGYAAMLTDDEAAALRKSHDVRFVEPDGEVHILEDVREVAPRLNAHAARSIKVMSSTHDHSVQEIPWGISFVDAPPVWTVARGANIKVGIIDTGIDKTHPDLKDRYKGGYDFYNGDDDPQDDNGHGSHVAGTIAASDNAFGVIGVAPEADLYALKVLGASGSGPFSNVISALDWAIEHKLNIVSLSLGGSEGSALLEEAFQKAHDAGIIAVAASGNGYDTNPVDGLSYPAAYPTVISVGAIDSTPTVASFSQRGAGLTVVAPGVDVLSTYLVNGLDYSLMTTSVGTFDALPMSGSKQTDLFGSLVYCGLGKSSDFTNVSGKIALIQRGEITFAAKVRNAKLAGAIGVVVYNNVPGPFAGTLIDPNDPTTSTYPWPAAISISKEDGDALRASGDGTPASLKFGLRDSYGELNGTSMATPHVSGVLALIWSAAPDATPDQVRNALETTTRDLGDAGYDTVYGNGVPDALAAAKQLAPQLFPAHHRRRGIRH